MNRAAIKSTLEDPTREWDVIVIGGGATGLGAALDAASRGHDTLLLEQADFSKGTSSRSTKLVHGGVRYLAQGNVKLVREALYERGLLRNNAPHLVQDEQFIIPGYTWWSKYYYSLGLKIYDLLSGKLSFGDSELISREETIRRLPTIKKEGLNGGVLYHDGQFDDSRLAVNLAQTITEQGGVVLNYMEVIGLVKEKQKDKVAGVQLRDALTGDTYEVRGRSVINATGVFVDEVLKMDKETHREILKPSQGVHLVVDRSYLPADNAIMIPKTDDGRVLFAVPWHNKVILGTTDTPLDSHQLEPEALDDEVEFILRNARRYLNKDLSRKDVTSVFAGLRPLAAPKEGKTKTKEISRSHKILVSTSGLISVVGGKWTTYRKMGEDIINKTEKVAKLPKRACVTKDLPIHGYTEKVDFEQPLYYYGADEPRVRALTEERPELAEKLHPSYEHIKAEVVWAVRHEYACTVEDFLARRCRMLFLDARAAIEMAPAVAELMAEELGEDLAWKEVQEQSFAYLAERYLPKERSPVTSSGQ